tara:strand:+ start:2086 stop:5220 length:3135 start_codon:yes stop_codon:yes gene_type:complete
MKKAPFTIYDAAAGSGKTFTLVKAYLEMVLATPETDYYRYLLAITFTNKAVAEMKNRIVWTLVDFGNAEKHQDPSPMFTEIATTLSISSETLQQRSRALLKHLLHHYALFSVETIDHFNHRILRTFSRDLNLPGNFEVSMDTEELLAEAVDRLISKAGTAENITQLLIDFALEKTDDDKSWDIARDIGDVASLLFSENDSVYLKQLREKSLSDFTDFRSKLLREKKERESAVAKLASEAVALIHAHGLDHTHFSGGYFYNFLVKVSEGVFQHNFDTAWQRTLAEKPLYPKKVSEAEAARVDSIAPDLIQSFYSIRESLFRLLLLENVLKNMTPLSVVHEVQQELEALKEENNLLLISEFNALIHDSIKDQPAPFIYERLGEKYRHFFIDEFQDTSLLQWENLKPLIANALVQQYREGLQGSLLLVGDAKQSIYRWRGGLPEQFISLYGEANPFPVEKSVQTLGTNFRSYSANIQFNNTFFQWISQYFKNPEHQALFQSGNKQEINAKSGGGVALHAVTADTKDALHEQYGSSVYNSIIELQKDAFSLGDICILCRTHNDGVQLSRYLLERGIPVISSESLLLAQAAVVQFLVNTLRIFMDAEDMTAKAAWLGFLHNQLSFEEKEHDFVAAQLHTSWEQLENVLSNKQVDFTAATAQQLSLYEMFAYCISSFRLETLGDSYLFHFMDLVFDFEQQPLSGKHSFLEFWEKKKEKAAISAPAESDAVRVMTIHQSKGLEFTVVLFPYADMKLYDHRNAKVWYPWASEDSLEHVLINYKNEVGLYGELGEAMVREQQSTLELDQINLLYVTLTRAVERLYIYFHKPKKMKETPQAFNEILAGFLHSDGHWDELTDVVRYGTFSTKQSKKHTEALPTIAPSYRSVLPETHRLHAVSQEALLWDTSPGEAIAWGDQLHGIMEQILQKEDVDWVLEEFALRKTLPKKDHEQLSNLVAALVKHPRLERFFTEGAPRVAVEKDIITTDGRVLRPDRLHFNEDGSVTVMDYKTGVRSTSHKDQIDRYGMALEAMGYPVVEKLIIYCSEEGIEIN